MQRVTIKTILIFQKKVGYAVPAGVKCLKYQSSSMPAQWAEE